MNILFYPIKTCIDHLWIPCPNTVQTHTLHHFGTLSQLRKGLKVVQLKIGRKECMLSIGEGNVDIIYFTIGVSSWPCSLYWLSNEWGGICWHVKWVAHTDISNDMANRQGQPSITVSNCCETMARVQQPHIAWTCALSNTTSTNVWMHLNKPHMDNAFLFLLNVHHVNPSMYSPSWLLFGLFPYLKSTNA